jgi:2-polyprenyl-6-methoxyphenol hydroxylase-like FAD-dependent oxidoreductase
MSSRDVRFPAAAPPAEVDVLIVGAGPVGLSAAVELTGRGVRVAVVDAATTAPLVRAGAMGHSPRVVEHFHRSGLLQRIRDAWTFPPEWNHGVRLRTSLAGHDLSPRPRPGFLDPAKPGPSLFPPIRRPQTALQEVFLTHLAERGVVVAGGWRVTELGEDTATVVNGTRRTVRFRYLIGADGGSSTVRRLSGIERDGEYATEKQYRLVVRTEDLSERLGRAPSGTNIVVNAVASGFLAAISTREWRVYAGPFPLDHEPTEAELLATARAAFGFDLPLEIASSTRFFRSTRIASAFRRGRVLLAGDAAHVRTPGGNLGEGFGDVVNLGWKLAAVIHGHAPDELLDSYDAERRPHNWRVADHALARHRQGASALESIRRDGIPDDADTGPAAVRRRAEIAELLASSPSGGDAPGVVFDERYDASPIIWYEPDQLATEQPWSADRYDQDPRPGHRAPDGRLDPWGYTLYDRIGNDFALLVLTDDDTVPRAVAAAAATRGLPLTVIHLTDPRLRELYHADNVLVRPDQHVAWRGTDLPPGGADAVLDLVTGHHALSPAVAG